MKPRPTKRWVSPKATRPSSELGGAGDDEQRVAVVLDLRAGVGVLGVLDGEVVQPELALDPVQQLAARLDEPDPHHVPVAARPRRRAVHRYVADPPAVEIDAGGDDPRLGFGGVETLRVVHLSLSACSSPLPNVPAFAGPKPPLSSRALEEAIMTTQVARVRTVFAVALLSVLLSACGYNTIPTLEEQAKAKWSDVQNNYQRRADLIPNLVATVQGYAKQEKDVLTSVVEARAKATQITLSADDLTDPGQGQGVPGRAEPALAARSAGCSRSARTIPTSSRTRTSSRCSRSSRAPRTASPSRGATTSRRCAPTTPSLRTFPGVLWAKTFFRGSKPMAEFTANDGAADAARGEVLMR